MPTCITCKATIKFIDGKFTCMKEICKNNNLPAHSEQIEIFLDLVIEYGKEFERAKNNFDFEQAKNIRDNLIPHWKKEIMNLVNELSSLEN